MSRDIDSACRGFETKTFVAICEAGDVVLMERMTDSARMPKIPHHSVRIQLVPLNVSVPAPKSETTEERMSVNGTRSL